MEGKIFVGVRCRPLSISEKITGEEAFDYFRADDPKAIYTLRNKYPFPHIFTPDASQEEIYLTLAEPLVAKILDGFNATIMAYGQTGSGKTYTMGTNMESRAPVQSGIMHRVLESLFLIPDIKVSFSFVEIYRENAYDLLSPKPRTKLSVMGFRAPDTVIKRLHSIDEARAILQAAIRNRRIGSTVANLQSSRSHAIATIFVTKQNGDSVQESKLNLVDLAGSEKVQVAGSPRNEGLAINCGLSHLTTVVTYLSSGMAHIPYRNSKLTSLLQDSLRLNNYISLIACFNPKRSDIEETEKTFDFASKCGRIKLVPVINNHALTPFKTPISTFRNRTYCGTEGFKRPMAPHNATIASPMVYSSVKRKPESLHADKIRKIDESQTNPRTWEARESVDSNWSDVSTSTTISDSRSPSYEKQNTVVSAAPRPVTPQMSSRQVEAIIKATAAETARVTEARMKAAFRSQLEEFRLQKERWSVRLVRASQDDSLEGLSRQESEDRSNEDENLSYSSLELERTVVESGNAKEFVHNREGTHPLDIDQKDNVESPPMMQPVIMRSAPRRSMRLSLRPPVYKQNDRAVDDIFRIPQAVSAKDDLVEQKSRRRTRLSVAQNESTADKLVRRSGRMSIVPDRYSPATIVVEKKQKTVKPSPAENDHQQRVLQILQSGGPKELQKLPTIGPKTALLIINHRLLYGPVTKVEEFKAIRGITKNQANKFLWANCLE